MQMELFVAKFGGSSMSNSEQVRKVVEIIRSDPRRRIVVVSAPGARPGVAKDSKVTGLLIDCAKARQAQTDWSSYMDEIMGRFDEIRAGFGLPESVTLEIREDLEARVDSCTDDEGRYMDLVMAGGEDNCARLFALALTAAGVPACYVDPCEAGMVLTSEHGNAQVMSETYTNLAHLRDCERAIVFPGFFGRTQEGQVATFPRGGSDITGSIVAAAVKAELYENFTDTPVCAANPKVVPGARPIPHLTYQEMRELSYAGFNVFQEEAPLPAMDKDIPICVKNTNDPDAPGTMITRNRDARHGSVVMGIASKEGFCTLFVRKFLMNREVGYVRRLMQVLEQESIPFEHMPSGIDDVSVIIREEYVKEDAEKITDRVRRELSPDEAWIKPGLALIMVVGAGMRDTPGITCRVAGALAAAGVNIEILNQGASEISLMIGIDAKDLDGAVKAIHAEFFEQEEGDCGCSECDER